MILANNAYGGSYPSARFFLDPVAFGVKIFGYVSAMQEV